MLSSPFRSEELLAGGELLRHHPSDADHRQPSVIELLGLHLKARGGILGHEAEGVELHVAGGVVAADRPHTRRRRIEEVVRPLEGEDARAEFVDTDGKDDERPELLERGLLEGNV